MTEFVLLDRDGVLNVDLPNSVRSIEDMSLIPGAAEAVAQLNLKGFHVLVITNQACVGRGDLSRATLDAIHDRIEDLVSEAGGRIDGWFVCPHREEEDCSCRKPRPGLLLQARDAFGFIPERTRFVGDATRDIEAARAAGCIPVLVRTGKGIATESLQPGVECHDSLLSFAFHTTPFGAPGA